MDQPYQSVVSKDPIPWQSREQLGWVGALFATIKLVLLSPKKFFEDLQIKDDWVEPLLFYSIVNIASGALATAMNVAFSKPQMPISASFMIQAGVLILLPLFLFVSTAFTHISVSVLGGKGGLKATYHVLAYAAAASVFNLIPVVGPSVAGVWSLVVVVIGIKRIHSFSTLRASFASVGLVIIIAIVALLAAIAIPNLLRAKLVTNEAMAQSTIRSFAQAVDSYVVMRGDGQPLNESDLQSVGFNLPLDGKVMHGYQYSVRLSSTGYEISAVPVYCKSSGSNVYVLKSGAKLMTLPCNAINLIDTKIESLSR